MTGAHVEVSPRLGGNAFTVRVDGRAVGTVYRVMGGYQGQVHGRSGRTEKDTYPGAVAEVVRLSTPAEVA